LLPGEEELESVSGLASSDLVLAIGGFAEPVEAGEALAVLGSKFMAWSTGPESEPLPPCLRAAPRLNCSTKALNCSLPELENLDSPTHENSSSSFSPIYCNQGDQIPIRRRID
jgi:hypothetical protein